MQLVLFPALKLKQGEELVVLRILRHVMYRSNQWIVQKQSMLRKDFQVQAFYSECNKEIHQCLNCLKADYII